MSVLARDLDAYQRALAAYQQRAGRYNRAGKQYDATVMKDPSGNPYVYGGEYDPLGTNSGQFYTADKESGKLSAATAPTGYAGMTKLPDSPQYSMLRTNPTSTQTKVLTNVFKAGGGVDSDGVRQPEYFYVAGPPDSEGNPTQRIIDAGKVRIVGQREGAEQNDGEGGVYRAPTQYTVEYDENSFQERPGEWTETFDKKAPDPTKAQLQQATRPSLAAQEAGLLGQAIRGGGLKTGSGGLIRSRMPEKQITDAERANK
ncbi:hypothetical protein UFOVP715_68 [uncultured Caudovirales phage]|uniref:Uncharacterized protein n=1 Tax=uncultured Caudovirales phage TaxID=2100421 RepID=A0A6J5NRB9_9CAUD|nr:hypothetical protein UFOVP715_68 [uncultured Caudovirales phage]